MSSRVADERGSILGEEVGYLIRFDSCCDPANTRIMVRIELNTPLLQRVPLTLVGRLQSECL